MADVPTLDDIRANAQRLAPYVDVTPIHRWSSASLDERLGQDARVTLKLELFQRTGTFKPRGALTVMMDMAPDVRARGVTAVSAGNHAIAVSYAASILGMTAKVVMPKTASPFRVERCRDYGGEVVLVEDTAAAFARMEDIARDERRSIVHPFEGPLTALGTATLGLEFLEQAGELDAVVIPIGG
ncbi:MAG: pyridoxal-phosphate dependent enzyme, partial [Candidatus Eremiobacteraeota bacterium]|nr:pyridoxal-phosphate dependent enzyme [Candidatus Eremiobacteraeota bacterium]